jgi:hypothetical protein
LALRTTMALVTGTLECTAHPVASAPAVATEPLMKSRLVNLM